MFRRNLFRRFLPVALAVAMTVQQVPFTSYAAEPEAVVTEVSETGTEPTETATTEETTTSQTGNDTEDAQENEQQTSEDTKTEETKTQEETKTEEETKAEETKEEDQVDLQAELPTSKIEFDESKLENVGEYHYSDGSYKGEYEPNVDTAKTNADNIVDAVKNATYAVIESNVNANDERDDLPFQYQWQKKGAEDKWEDITYPQDAGEYRVKVSLAEQANLCKAAEDAFVNFTIEKAKFTITPASYSVESGITVAEVKTKIADNYTIGNDITKAAAVKECKVEIKTATGTEALADDVTIEKNESYVVVYTFTLTDDFAKNYELSDPADYTFNISQTVKTTTITVEFNKQGEAVGKKYDGNAIDITKDIVPAIKTLKVTVPNSDRDDNGLVLIEGTDNIDKLNPTWGTKTLDEKFVALDSAPTDAGDYYLRLEYKNENGTYGSTTEYIRVVITPVDIAIVPEVSQTEWNDGDKVSDIIKKVTYKVYDVADGKRAESARTDIDEYFWGDAYGVDLYDYENGGNTTADGIGEQYFKPLFVVERGVTKDGVTTWTTLKPNDTIQNPDLVAADASVKYRVAYSGKLCVYGTNEKGEPRILATNADVNNVQGNYKVDLTEAAKDADSKALTIEESQAVTIDVSALLGENKAGESYDNAIISTYTGKSIFSSKSDYKKAAIVGADEKPISSDAEKDFTYTWQYAHLDDDDKETGTPMWNDFNDVENHSAPYNTGNYRLEITYTDKTNANRAKEKAYVYYTILPQDAIAVITGAPEAYADGKTTIGDYLDLLTSETDFTLYSYNKDTKTKGDEIKLDVEEKAGLRNSFAVKVKAVEGEKAGKYVECNSSDQFISGRDYVLDINSGRWNYNFGYDLDKHGDYKSYDTIWDNETCPITVKESKGIEVKIDVDRTKITDTSKNYDGKNFDLTEIKKAVRFVNAKTGEDLTEALKDKVKYYFVLEDDGNGHVAPIKTYDRYSYDAYLVSKNEIVAEDDPVIHGGTYALVWSLEADENYAAVVPVDADGICNHNSCITDITINKRELTITPVLNGEIKAGTHTNNIVTKTGSNNYTDQYQLADPIVSGFVDDKEAENAFYKFTVSVHEDTKSDDVYAGILKSDTKYYLVENAEMKAGLSYRGYYTVTDPTYYERDYSPVSERIAFTPVRAEASVNSITYNEAGNWVKAIDTISGSAQDGYIHTITTRSAIPYDSTGVTIGGKNVVGNNYKIQITAPKEFKNSLSANDVVYKTAVENAGGAYLYDGNVVDGLPVITVVFNANNTKTAEFDIVWKPGYKETFKLDFTNAQLVNDFTKAVAPKSLAFNNVNKKMAVGETQQLDVKITKKQMSDIILLGYSVDNGDVLQVSDSGYVTALSKGTATVSVFPCFKDVNDGNKVKQIEGTKAVTVKITVADVATPKISKITAFGSKAEVKYAEVANGYRREIYVLEGKNLKATEFESKIADAIKGNGDYSAFDYVKLGAEEVTDKKVTTIVVSGLQPNKEYTVYVRNVAALRELKNGAKVATSYAGAVKGFKTTAAENNGLRVYFDLNAKNNKVYCDDTEERCDAQHTGLYHNFTVKLTDKKATVSVDASYLQGLSYSDNDDFIWRTLPLSKDDQKSYLNPKLEYYAMSTDDYSYDYDALMDAVKHDRNKSGLATVDKKGNVSLKGAGWVYIYAVDPVTENVGEVALHIVAEANSVTGKNVTLTEGQYIWLSDYLTYKQGGTAIANYCSNNNFELSVDQSSNEFFKIEKSDASNYSLDSNGKYGAGYPYGSVNYKITALKAGGKLTLTVTDKTVAANGGKPATVKLTSKAIAPVKGLKAKNVTDTDFRITFTDSASSNARYRVDVTDERGKVVKSEIVSTNNVYSSNQLIDNPEYKEYFEVGYDVVDDEWNNNLAYYDAKTKTNTYSYYVSDNSINLLSTYNVTVTALYDNGTGTYVESKAAKTKVKTTNIPASKTRLLKEWSNAGEGISINTKDKYGNNYRPLYNPDEVSYNRLRSGNKYTLSIDLVDDTARVRKTDTLTWKSTDSKVATVKANAGSFTATLKAVKPGKTTIEVTSKITKSVIARYDVYVVASGDAGQYFGDNEPYDTTREFTNLFDLTDAINEGSVIELDADVKKTVRVDANTRQWFSFTAPQYGGYSFDASETIYSLYYDDDTEKVLKNYSSAIGIEKGTKVYFYVDNYSETSENMWAKVTATSKFSELALGDNAIAKGGNYIFIAPTADHYTFTYVKTVTDKDGKTQDEVLDTQQFNLGKGGKTSTNGYFGSTIIIPNGTTKIVITTRATAEAPKAGATTDVTFDKTGIWQYFKFTAEEDGLYTFDVEDIAEGATVSIDIEESLSDTNYDVINNGATSSQNIDTAVELKKGKTIYLGIKATRLAFNSDKTKNTEKFTCKLKVTKVDSVTDKPVTVEKGKTSYVSYQYPENGKYRFTVTTSTEGLTTAPTIWIDGTSGNVREVTNAKKNDIVAIKITNNDAAKDATFTVKVEKLVTDVLAVDKDNKVSLVKGVGKTVEFPVTKSGIYTVTAKDSNGGVIIDNTNYYQAGVTKTFELVDTYKTEVVTVKVTEQPINTLKSEEVSFSKDGETKYFKFTADKEGHYSIKLDTTAAANTTVYKPATINVIVSGTASWEDIDRYMSAGETVYVRMVSTANAVGDKVKVTITSDTVEAVGDGVTVAKQTAEGVVTTKYVSFVAPKKARYQVSFGSNVSVKYDDGIDGDYVYQYPAQGMVLNAGRKIYFKVTNNSTEADYTFKVSEVEAKKVGESVSLKAGQGAWFVLTTEAKAADTLYNFEATAENEAKDASATITRKVDYDLANKYADMETTMVVVPGNASVYYYVTTDKDASVKLTATASATDELTKAEGYEFDGQVTKTFTTTAPEDGFYSISAKIGDNVTYGYTVDKVTNGIKSEDGTYIIRLKKGDKIAVQITSELPGKNTFKFTLDKLTEITAAGKDITLKSGVEQKVVFVPSEATTYMITKSYSSDKITYSDGLESEVEPFNTIADAYYPMWLYVVTSDNSDVTVNVKATPVVPTALTVDGDAKTISEADAKKGTPVYYSVDVEKDKAYAIKASNAYVEYNYSIKEIEWDADTGVNFNADQGGKLYIKVTPNADKEVSVKVISKAAEEITVDTAKTIDISKVQPGEYVYYSFTVPEDGEYTASFAADKDETGTYSASYDVVKKVGGSTTTAKYYKDNKVLYRVYYNSTDLKKNLTFKVTKTATKAITTVNEDVTVNVPANGSIKLTYVAASDEYPSMAISEAVAGVDISERSQISATSAKPVTYAWTLTNDNAEAKDVKVKITVPKVDVTLNLGSNDVTFDTTKTPAETSKVVAFTADKAGEYKVTKLDKDGNEVSVNSSLKLAKGQKYVTTVYSDAEVNEGKKIVVKVSLVQEATVLELGKQFRGTGASTLYVFTATTGGEYAVKYSNSDYESLGKLAAGESYMFTGEIDTSTLLSVERTDNK